MEVYKMDKFLEIVYTNQLADSEKGDKFEEFFKPLMDKVKSTVSEELFNHLKIYLWIVRWKITAFTQLKE